ncbi:MarR family winged helix-turn-helix transcriptional regulator [Sciscionella marina]|uniref:MarR family winged helix-turn-helix transcriptional regulator n=1 Tax=Sciscionella marina TaxID=508770 RepID=UPI0003691EBB|nr:MarR family winged helix-turn-helix transcriptional regulator [Sciscionella marina]
MRKQPRKPRAHKQQAAPRKRARADTTPGKLARKQARADNKVARRRAKAATRADKANKAAKKQQPIPSFLGPNATGTDSLELAERQLTLLVRTTAMLAQENTREAPLDRSSYLLLCTLDKKGPSTISTLAAELCLAASTVTRQVATMCAAGLVSSAAHPNDRRARVITMESHGKELFVAERKRRRGVLRAITGSWTDDECEQLAELLSRLNTSLGQLFEGAPLAYEL